MALLQLRQNAAGGIHGAVVYHHQFHIAVVLGKDGLAGALQSLGCVVGRDDHTDGSVFGIGHGMYSSFSSGIT